MPLFIWAKSFSEVLNQTTAFPEVLWEIGQGSFPGRSSVATPFPGQAPRPHDVMAFHHVQIQKGLSHIL